MKVDTEMLYGLSKISVVLMAVYFVMKGADLLMRGQLGNVFSQNRPRVDTISMKDGK